VFDISQEKYDHLWTGLSYIINKSIQLPQKIVARKYKYSYLFEDHLFMEEDFYNDICFIAKCHGDENINLMILEPDPIKYYKKHFSLIPFVCWSITDSYDNYWDIINHSPSEKYADSIVDRVDTMVFYSDSFKWCIYIDRNFEVGFIFLFNQDINIKEMSCYYFTDMLDFTNNCYIQGTPEEVDEISEWL
jgi:hypothetical protein